MARNGGKNENVFEILITTDNHVGYYENDVVMGDDSFNSFEETLQIANDLDVDFVLLGGDLFHEQRPTQLTYEKASGIFNRQVFNSEETQDGRKSFTQNVKRH